MTRLQCLDVAMTVAATPATLREQFTSLYRACERPDARGATEIELGLHRCNSHYSLVMNDAVAATAASARDILMCTSMQIDHACVRASSDTYLMVHASCVARAARAALIVGPSSAGKSTLAAALTLAGFDYIGDEVIGIPAGTVELSAYPKPLKLDGRARHLLGDAFGRADLCRGADQAEDLIPPATLGFARLAGTRTEPALVVVPSLEPRSAVRVEKVSRADVAELLADQCFNFPSWGARGLNTIADIARACDGVRLRFGDLAEAASMIERLLS